MSLLEEELLEPIVRAERFRQGLAEFPQNKPLTIVDLGSGPKIRLYHAALKKGINIKSYIGIDPLIEKSHLEKQKGPIKIIKDPLDTAIPLPDKSADVLAGFAFLEHIDHPIQILNDAIRVLKPGGKAIFTTPTPRAKAILEFLSYKMGIIARREIEEHKNYFTKENLVDLLENPKALKITHRYFELGCNNLFIIEKA